MGLPHDSSGKPIPSQLGVIGSFVPKGAKNVEVAKDFLKYMIQPKVVNEYLKSALGRFLPTMPELVKNDPFWLDPKDPHRANYARQGMLEPTVPVYPVFNPGFAEANAQQIWGAAEADVIREGMTPQAAAEKALNGLLRPKRKADGTYTFAWFQRGGVQTVERIGTAAPVAAKWTPTEAQLKEYEGNYPLSPTFAPRVFSTGPKLLVQGTDQAPLEAAPVEKDIFVAESVGAEVDFERDASGKVMALTLTQRGQVLRGERH
jgi:hypothetical protein